jgi:hypothetical protein
MLLETDHNLTFKLVSVILICIFLCLFYLGNSRAINGSEAGYGNSESKQDIPCDPQYIAINRNLSKWQ